MLPKQLQNILDDLKSQEWIQKLARNAELYVVGGSVRDGFIGKPIKDVDIIVDGLSFSGIQKVLKPFGKQNLVGDSFSVIKFKPHGYEGEDFDIAVPREDRKVGAGHKGFEIVTDGVDVHGDLKRRDFTINSMAINIMDETLLDPFNGLKDLKDKKIKATDPQAFIEDPLRILRGIQFASRFGFKIDKGTLKMMKDNAHLIKEITGERILEEFEKVITKGNTQIALNLLHETDVDKALFDKKMLKYDEGFDYLDSISFYYMLGLIGDKDPYNFYMQRLKGKLEIGMGIQILSNLIDKWDSSEDLDKKYLIMKAISKIPKLDNIALLPPEADDIILDMRKGNLPMTTKDIPVTGEDVMIILNIPPSKKVGDILEIMSRDALDNKYNWKDRNDAIDYLSKLS